MRMRIKVVPKDQPNADGKWITRKIRRVPPAPWHSGPPGFVVVSYRRPHRKKKKKHQRRLFA